MNQSKGISSVQSVDRALVILDYLKENSDGIGITDLAREMGLAKSTIHRLITSLKNKGYVRQDQLTERYMLGFKFFEMFSAVSQSMEIRKIATPFMQQLVDETGETSHLVMLDGGEITYIEKIESSNTIRMYSYLGRRAPVHCTGAGKALLAFLPETQILSIIEEYGLKKYTDTTFTEKEAFLHELKSIREKGYSIDNEEHEEGIRCIACPIFNHEGKVVSSVSIAGPTMRMTDEKIETCIPRVIHCAQEISKRNYFHK